MKKNLLTLTFLCGLGLSAQAQWVLQNTVNPETPPDYISTQMQVVSDQVAWQLMQEDVTGATTNAFAKTVNGGTAWTFGSVNGTPTYQAAGIHALNGTTAHVAQFGAGGGGEIIRTTDGGNAWTKTTTAGQFVAPVGFANWVYFFDANNGVSLGDPRNGSFEVYTTSNGGTSWTLVPAANLPAPLDADEYGLVGSYCAIGNTIWAGTTHLLGGSAANPLPARILKSTNRGLTWTASAVTPLQGFISKVAMSDANNGLAFRGSDLIATTDGGATWQTRAYTGNFCHYDMTNVPGTNIIVSVGSSVTTPTTLADIGSSYTTNNGATWTDIDRGKFHATVDFLSRTVGYTGSVTDATGAGGTYRSTATILGTSNRNPELQSALSVYPNPSATGVFSLKLNSGIKAGTNVRVMDALGRQVLNQQLNATAIASQIATVDMSKEKAGVYTLELRTDSGVAQQKLVIQ